MTEKKFIWYLVCRACRKSVCSLFKCTRLTIARGSKILFTTKNPQRQFASGFLPKQAGEDRVQEAWNQLEMKLKSLGGYFSTLCYIWILSIDQHGYLVQMHYLIVFLRQAAIWVSGFNLSCHASIGLTKLSCRRCSGSKILRLTLIR